MGFGVCSCSCFVEGDSAFEDSGGDVDVVSRVPSESERLERSGGAGIGMESWCDGPGSRRSWFWFWSRTCEMEEAGVSLCVVSSSVVESDPSSTTSGMISETSSSGFSKEGCRVQESLAKKRKKLHWSIDRTHFLALRGVRSRGIRSRGSDFLLFLMLFLHAHGQC